MRILTYLPALETGGAELHLAQVGRELAERGHQIDLMYEREGNLSADFRAFCDHLTRRRSPLYSSNPLRDVPRVAALALASSRPRPDLIYANNFTELLWANSVGALTRAPVVCHLHQFHQFNRGSMMALGRWPKRFIANSGYLRTQWAQSGISPDRIVVISNGFGLDDYPPGSTSEREQARARLGLPQDAYVILYLGRMVPEKGIDTLFDAWSALGLSPEDGRLLVVGTPENPAAEDSYLRELRRKSPIGCDFLPVRRDVISILHAADVLVLPSVWDEPFGRVVVETLATGRPVVASSVGGIPEILDGEFSGMLFPRGDVPALTERLRALRNWRQDDPDLARRCVEHAVRKYGLKTVASEYEQLFESLVQPTAK
jgi:glycosyltransferase involved in cell wall biosynthesis